MEDSIPFILELDNIQNVQDLALQLHQRNRISKEEKARAPVEVVGQGRNLLLELQMNGDLVIHTS